jgi:hypothetical protein
MTQPSSPAADDARTPPLAKDLDAVQVRYTWKLGEAGAQPAPTDRTAAAASGAPSTEEPSGEVDAVAALHSQIRHFTSALEDIVTLALSSADYKERAIMMHRRAVAALSGAPVRK